jgi:hypothetical protein
VSVFDYSSNYFQLIFLWSGTVLHVRPLRLKSVMSEVQGHALRARKWGRCGHEAIHPQAADMVKACQTRRTLTRKIRRLTTDYFIAKVVVCFHGTSWFCRIHMTDFLAQNFGFRFVAGMVNPISRSCSDGSIRWVYDHVCDMSRDVSGWSTISPWIHWCCQLSVFDGFFSLSILKVGTIPGWLTTVFVDVNAAKVV